MVTLNFEELFSKRLGAIKPGLERISRAYDCLGQPAEGAFNILVGGTNGKGGTSGFLWAFLAHGRKAGLFTSPHLRSFGERFQLSHEPLEESHIHDTWHELKEQLGSFYDELSFFELATLIAYDCFAKKGTEFNVMEVGLGGRWDSTNVVNPDLAIVTSISRDHEEFLGSNLLGIAKEKLGICRPNAPLIWGGGGEAEGDPEVESYLDNFCLEHNIPLFRWEKSFSCNGNEFWLSVNATKNHYDFPYGLRRAPTFVKRNFTLAAVAYELIRCHDPSLPELTQVLASFPSPMLPCPNSLVGRFQRMTLDDKYVIFDVCHNPDGMNQLTRNLELSGLQAGTALISILKDKKFDEMLDIAKETFSQVLLFGIEHERGFSLADLAARHQDLAYFGRFSDAWASIPQSNRASPLVICGSVLAVGRVFEQFEKDPKEFTCDQVLLGTWANPESPD
ncbi:bifunctional folylpolyglutamate synthase/dihydrofolate synthase [Pseudobacteriovorax antillogorgiicola]|uniref:Dihydrofolate synthase / folylpolyglutamate synthase n=1 Tax=Pseudobacteriovorax antillogorgiicola TaxID=1513793 RepID=A0A1Y6BP83_9BACT|nr:Mur ligase family protein [Pseudobacteriovorax antillogorgiicola]TCS53794.1 dihydrofolate synthase/folylpolyglutamate synthase [Pseudobacteriovorax antillogorgiicola]SMF22184.1 dihydrofolate synthase / folylpolyglutamate synthase [Pseudobacteriovorax antillogorgiicola]